jgi:hypothetical protein
VEWSAYLLLPKYNLSILMFANIVVCTSLLVNIVALKSTIRGVLFILRPTYTTCFEKIDDGLDGGVESGEGIIRDAMSIAR